MIVSCAGEAARGVTGCYVCNAPSRSKVSKNVDPVSGGDQPHNAHRSVRGGG